MRARRSRRAAAEVPEGAGQARGVGACGCLATARAGALTSLQRPSGCGLLTVRDLRGDECEFSKAIFFPLPPFGPNASFYVGVSFRSIKLF